MGFDEYSNPFFIPGTSLFFLNAGTSAGNGILNIRLGFGFFISLITQRCCKLQHASELILRIWCIYNRGRAQSSCVRMEF